MTRKRQVQYLKDKHTKTEQTSNIFLEENRFYVYIFMVEGLGFQGIPSIIEDNDWCGVEACNVKANNL